MSIFYKVIVDYDYDDPVPGEGIKTAEFHEMWKMFLEKEEKFAFDHHEVLEKIYYDIHDTPFNAVNRPEDEPDIEPPSKEMFEETQRELDEIEAEKKRKIKEAKDKKRKYRDSHTVDLWKNDKRNKFKK